MDKSENRFALATGPLFAGLILILLPVLILVLALAGARPFATLAGLWGIFTALKGTQIDFQSADGILVIHVF